MNDIQPIATDGPVRPLSRLRQLGRAGIGPDLAPLRALLTQISDPLDLDAAGSLLAGEKLQHQLAAITGLREQRIAVLGSSTLNMVPNLLQAMLLREGILGRFLTSDFDQWRIEIMTGAPALAPFQPRLTLCLLDEEAVFSGVTVPHDVDALEARCAGFAAEVADWVRRCRALAGGRVVLATVPLSRRRAGHLLDYAGRARLSAAWARMNAALLDLAESAEGVSVLDAAILTESAGTCHAADRMRQAAGMAFAPEFLAAYAEEVTRIARADLGMARKALALDLDNTLWGGVVGDVGVGALALGRMWPGTPHHELQTLAKSYAAQGVILTVCSKNDDGVARGALTEHPEMVLGARDLSLITANWEPKAQNLKAQAKSLNIGTDAFVFMDDHPVERGAMREFLPEVQTIELADEPSGYASALAASGAFNLLRLTDEDRQRTALYRAQTDRAEAAVGISLEEYLRKLDSHLVLEPLGELNVTRITQLFGKTNQFNLTQKRYAESELRDGSRRSWGARLTDRFGDSGLIAAVTMIDHADGTSEIENVVLSCRAFSRGVEEAVMSLILNGARRRGRVAVTGRYVASAKNGRCATFYDEMGFRPAGEGWCHDLHEILPVPDQITATEEE
ncbi:HAD-IIIC family phosphatase [Paracoccus aminophilus]|uniref:Methoxymalonyl-ACP biosynthesis protein n=1 Tax=Paracoccus aminophilus JCM 7686 TaxID=1367847 RepID=S5YCN5_PARAH|nr:HAD-IIIC family phosphatase [Paracoccus aminophilus]AGT09203.1 methoxymalonyl-ACP biosynthesis protein [Paracoccus aminophilus JCM 7686]